MSGELHVFSDERVIAPRVLLTWMNIPFPVVACVFRNTLDSIDCWVFRLVEPKPSLCNDFLIHF
jgi:hypothetical protein